MQQVYWIKSSQTWTCPKAGAWKVVCVGGGASGGVSAGVRGTSSLQSAGGTTSFGSLLSASGGTTGHVAYISTCGGYGGFDGMNYGGTPVMLEILGSTRVPYASSGNGGILGCSGLGYGAGGGVGSINSINVKKDSTATSINIYAVPGKCGDMTIGIFDLALNQSVACTVGTSVKPSITASSLLTYIKAADSSVTEVTSDPTIIANAITAGTSGVVYIEFLG